DGVAGCWGDRGEEPYPTTPPPHDPIALRPHHPQLRWSI
ncbi:MAG: hypothetical protein AVDCRST_MAG59-1809, partial [uncultured Thermomicrobiales bacterium]